MAFTAHERHHFHFFGNREITSLYFTIALLSFAEGLIGVFIPIYFWQLGYPLWRILFFYFLISLAFVIWSFLLLPLMRKMSDKTMMFLGIPFLVLYFLGLGYIETFPVLFYILPAIVTINHLFFNVGYHLDFAGSADRDHIGTEVGTRFMVASLVQLASPFLGGVLITFFGFQSTFFIATFFLLAAIVPLFFFPKRTVSPHFNAKSIVKFLGDKSLRAFNLSGVGYAAERMTGNIIWPLFIFLAIGSLEKLGGVISLGLLGGAMITFLSGYMSDAGRRRKILRWTTLLFSFIWATRPFLASAVPIVSSHIVGHLAYSGLMVSWSSQYYKIARTTHIPGVFIVSREILYRATRVLFLPVLMLLAYLLPLGQFFSVSFLLAAFFTLFFLFANRFHREKLDSVIMDGEQP